MREIAPGIWQSGLPLVRELRDFYASGGCTAVDLTRRSRDKQRKACERLGLIYIKHGLPYSGGAYDDACTAVLEATRPVLFWCFHGRDRSGVIARRVRMREVGAVVLYQVGRNLNRAYRTCESFGVRRMHLVDCGDMLTGNLYRAAGRVAIESIDDIPQGPGVVALETWGSVSVDAVDWTLVHTVILGGESSGLPRGLDVEYVRIPQCGLISGLTVEAALAIGLHEWGRQC